MNNTKVTFLFLFILLFCAFNVSNLKAADIKSGVVLSSEDMGVKILETTHQSGYSFYINSKIRNDIEKQTYFSFGMRYYLNKRIDYSPFVSAELFSFDNECLFKIGGGYRTNHLVFEAGYKNFGPINIYFGLSFDFTWGTRERYSFNHIHIDID
jgi:hypothetical protein